MGFGRTGDAFGKDGFLECCAHDSRFHGYPGGGCLSFGGSGGGDEAYRLQVQEMHDSLRFLFFLPGSGWRAKYVKIVSIYI